jgi:aspartyl protease family protein
MFRSIVLFSAIALMVVVTVRHLEGVGQVPATAAAVKADPAPTAAPTNSRMLVLKANAGGQFEVDARVDGRRIGFLVDTGASQIALRESDAALLGFHPTPRDYSVRLMTANGEGRAARVELRMVEVGNIVVRDLAALVTPDDMLSVNLLGMSFLSRVRWSHDRGNLILEQ